MCSIDVYLGPPGIFANDAGKNFMGSAFQVNSDILHIKTKSIPLESANSMSIAERYHSPICRAYNIILSEALDLYEEAALQMVVKHLNNSIGSNGPVPTLLVFGAPSRLGLPYNSQLLLTYK